MHSSAESAAAAEEKGAAGTALSKQGITALAVMQNHGHSRRSVWWTAGRSSDPITRAAGQSAVFICQGRFVCSCGQVCCHAITSKAKEASADWLIVEAVLAEHLAACRSVLGVPTDSPPMQ
jgi:hypothetical protein